MLIIRDGRNTVNRKKKKTAAKREASAAGGCIIPVIVFRKHTDKLEFARRAGGQVVTGVVCNRSQPFNLGMIAPGNHLDLDSLRAAPPARYRSVVRQIGNL